MRPSSTAAALAVRLSGAIADNLFSLSVFSLQHLTERKEKTGRRTGK
jgi:hypothetical protein